jgi:hypothetical protein
LPLPQVREVVQFLGRNSRLDRHRGRVVKPTFQTRC